MSDEKIIDFDQAKQPHVFGRKDEKLKNMKSAFKAAREKAGSNSKSSRHTSRGKKKKRQVGTDHESVWPAATGQIANTNELFGMQGKPALVPGQPIVEC